MSKQKNKYTALIIETIDKIKETYPEFNSDPNNPKYNDELLKILDEYIKKDNLELVKAIIDSGFDVNSSPLIHTAIEYNNIEIVTYLISKGADINAVIKIDHEHERPLHIAAKENNSDILQLLIDKGAIINSYGEDNDSPLYRAIQYYSSECIEIFLKHGENAGLSKHYSVLQEITQDEDREAIIMIDSKAFADMIYDDNYDKNALDGYGDFEEPISELEQDMLIKKVKTKSIDWLKFLIKKHGIPDCLYSMEKHTAYPHIDQNILEEINAAIAQKIDLKTDEEIIDKIGISVASIAHKAYPEIFKNSVSYNFYSSILEDKNIGDNKKTYKDKEELIEIFDLYQKEEYITYQPKNFLEYLYSSDEREILSLISDFPKEMLHIINIIQSKSKDKFVSSNDMIFINKLKNVIETIPIIFLTSSIEKEETIERLESQLYDKNSEIGKLNKIINDMNAEKQEGYSKSLYTERVRKSPETDITDSSEINNPFKKQNINRR